MKAVLQCVQHAEVTVNNEIIGKVNKGYMILVGVVDGDTDAEALLLADKTAGLRVFCDENDKMNLSLLDIDGEALVVSQFTLCADCRKGRRPSFTDSAAPAEAKRLYELYVSRLKELGVRKVETGEFGADMKVGLVNDGPVTILFNTDEWKKSGK